jgi:hypothetical protein
VFASGCWGEGARFETGDGRLVVDYFDAHSLGDGAFLNSSRFTGTAYDHMMLAFRLHDINGPLLGGVLERAVAAMLCRVRERFPLPKRFVWQGLWQQNVVRKPEPFKAAATATRTLCYMQAVDAALRSPLSRGLQPGLAFVDTYALSLAVQDECVDGTHFSPAVMASVALLVLHKRMAEQQR